jgi:hypothetical protein
MSLNALAPTLIPDGRYPHAAAGGWIHPGTQVRSRFSGGGAVLAFLIGLGSRLNVQVIGFLPLSELGILLAAPFLLPALTSRRTTQVCRTAMILAGVWFVSQLLTDLALGTRFDLAARGAARVIVLLAMIPFFSWYMATHRVEKIVWITLGSIPSGILSTFFLKSGVQAAREQVYGDAMLNWETHWSFLGNAAIALVALALYRRRRLLSYLVVASLGAAQVALGSRASGAGAVAAVGLSIAYNAVSSGRLRFPRVSLRVAFILGLASVVTMTAIYQAYQFAASNGYLGDRAYAKFTIQSQYKYGLLLGGRPDAVPGVLAIIESPLMGYGSWPLDEQGFYLKGCELTGTRPSPLFYKVGYPKIPSHSHVIGAWVEGGVLASLFWFYVIYVAGRSVVTPLFNEPRLRLWASVAAVALTWHVLFSPISGRLRTAMFMSVFLLERRQAQLASLGLMPGVQLPAPRRFPNVA